MKSLGPLNTMDANILPQHPNGKLQAAQQPPLQAPPPLDRIGSEAPFPSLATNEAGDPSHNSRPSLTGMPSFQRQRKRVIWRNKACFIALPLEDESGRRTSRESYLSPDDFERRLKDWKTNGFDISGFTLAPQTSDSHSPSLEGQTRAVHPDPEDERRERADGVYRVNIPDQQYWEAHVNHLKEDKLRALGVDEQIPRKSPSVSVMSGPGSSQSSAVLRSPTLASSSRVVPSPTSFYDAANPASYIGKSGVSHYSRYSPARPSNDSSPVSPKHFSQPLESHMPGMRSPQTYITSQQSSRGASPGAKKIVQTPGHAAPSASPEGIDSIGQASNQHSSDVLARMREQQYHYQQQILQRCSLNPLVISQNGEQSLQPVAVNNPTAAIATPIPCGDCQNAGEILQKGIDEIEDLVPYSMHEKRERSKAVRNDEEYNENLTDISSNKVERAAPQNARASGSVLGACLSAKAIPDQETNHPRQSQSNYPLKPSQLNVNAPKFKPRFLQNSDALSLLGDPQAHNVIESESSSFAKSREALQALNEASQPMNWNVTAAAFMPKSSVKATFPSREFSFSASRPSFRPEAPEFKPNDPGVASGPESSSNENGVQRGNKIFGDFDFPGVIKNSNSETMPVFKSSKESQSKGESNGDVDGQEDESGRITQADGRQKRMRRERDDRDQVPIFASPEREHPWMGRGCVDRATHFSRTSSPESTAADAATLDAATDLLEGLIDDLSTTEASDLMRGEESADEDGENRNKYVFNDLGEAASFNTARPPGPHEVARATQDFLGISPQFTTELNRAFGHRNSSSGSSRSSTIDEGEAYERRPRLGTEDLVDRIDYASQGTHANIMNGVRYVEPSYNELDAIMKHLNRDDSDLGVERQPSPWKGRNPSASPIRYASPKLHDSPRPHTVLPQANIRNDTPSPGPNRLQLKYQYLPPTDSESADPSLVEMVTRSARYSPSYRPSKTSPPIHPLNSPGDSARSEMNDSTLFRDVDEFRTKTSLDNNINDLVDGIVQRELKPLELALYGIQQSIARLSDRSTSKRPGSSGALEIEHSDADDEDDVDEVSQSRLKSPLRDRKFEQLKASIGEIAAAQQSIAPASQQAEMMAIIRDLKVSMQQIIPPPPLSGDIKNIVEEAVGRQMRGRSAPVTSSSQAAAAEKSQLHIAGLESMLKIAESRANDEMQARRSVEDELADKARSLQIALQEASQQRESAEATERSLQDFHTERQQSLQRNVMLECSQESLQKAALDLSEKNLVLEETLGEYRLSSDQWRSEISDVKHENKDLRRIISSLKAEIEETVQGRQALRAKVDHLQGEVATAARNVASDRMGLLNKEEEHKARLGTLGARLEVETRNRERLELEIERVEAQEMEAMKTRSMAEQMQKTNVHLESLLAELRSECQDHQSVIARLHQRIDFVTADADRSRSSRKLILEEVSDSRDAALGEATRFHERTVGELKAQHERSLNNALEDKERSESFFGNQLNLADEKVIHYQDRINHLEEKLEIAKSAAHAAAQAAQSKKAVLSPSPMSKASNREPSSEIITPEALRESILVLQEQLQERERTIEQLELTVSSVDTTAKSRIKEAETEMTWLRELLGMRIDDIQDLIATVSQPSYDPEGVKDAAIRLKANLQMEQQEKERALASFPSLARISNLAASPKALPLAAAAAWGNWRKGQSAIQTPLKSSPQSFFAGLMTPPSTEMRTTPPFNGSRTYLPSSRRSVRATTIPNQGLSCHEDRDRPLRRLLQQDPVTPPLMRKGSYDLDASESAAFGDEAVECNKKPRDEEPFGPNPGGNVREEKKRDQ